MEIYFNASFVSWGGQMTATYARSSGIEMAPLQDETILFDPGQNRFCVLNRTATFIWNRLATALTKEALAAEICENFSGIVAETALSDADRTLRLLVSLKVVVDESGEPGNDSVEIKHPLSLATGSDHSELPAYEPPHVTAMNENEVLSAFQVPVVATTWWG
jgi:Coenzyme PQQ synthesis protein D (PqqD)